MQYIVFGANGYIGSYLYRRMKEDGKHVIGTRHNETGSRDYLKFDILKDDVSNIIEDVQDEEKTAIICIAQSNINVCYENYNLSYMINVVKTKELISKLAENRFHIIFFSTDNVFDGKSGAYQESSMTNAINKYGMMKAEMENYLLDKEPEVCILRISKVVGSGMDAKNILFEFDEKAQKGGVRCIRGNRISFVAIEDIYQACLIVSQKKMHGLYNITGDKAFSRAELAEKFFMKSGNKHVNIEECGADEFDLKDERPLDISMSNLKFRHETGYQFTSMDSVINDYIDNKKMK